MKYILRLSLVLSLLYCAIPIRTVGQNVADEIRACMEALDKGMQRKFSLSSTEFQSQAASALKYSYEQLKQMREVGSVSAGADLSIPLIDSLLSFGGQYDSKQAREAYEQLRVAYATTEANTLSSSDLRIVVDRFLTDPAFDLAKKCLDELRFRSGLRVICPVHPTEETFGLNLRYTRAAGSPEKLVIESVSFENCEPGQKLEKGIEISWESAFRFKRQRPGTASIVVIQFVGFAPIHEIVQPYRKIGEVDAQEGLARLEHQISALRGELVVATRSSSAPIGSVMAWPGKRESIPEGWEPCEGQEVDLPKSVGEALTVAGIAIHFPKGERARTRLPDYRGYFLRGLDSTGTIDPDRRGAIAGSVQLDEMKSHVHEIARDQHQTSYGAGLLTLASGGPTIAPASTGPNAGGGAETRPKNVAVHWIIKLR